MNNLPQMEIGKTKGVSKNKNQVKYWRDKKMRKAGFEPARLAPPPPQDGVSASSTTSASVKIREKRDFRQIQKAMNI
jgi:hypothetical protein